MWLDRQQKNLYLEQFTKTDKELIKPDMWMKYRETPADNFTLAIPAANSACQEPHGTKAKKKQTLEQMPGRRTFTDSSQENTTVEVSTHCNDRTKNYETKNVPNGRGKESQVHF